MFLLGVVAAIVLSGRGGRRSVAVVGCGLAALAALEGVAMLVVFPGAGVYPFLVWHLLAVGALALAGSLLAYRDRATRPIALLLCGWGFASLTAFLIPNPVGDNLARLRYAVFPLLLLLAVRRRRRGLASIVAAAALVYAAAPDLFQVGGQADASSSHAQAWRPAVSYLRHHLPAGARVEVVPTSARWEAYYLPARGIPLARGWFRQTDMARNAVLYRRSLTRYGVRRVAPALGRPVRAPHALPAGRSWRARRGAPAHGARVRPADRLEACGLYDLCRGPAREVDDGPAGVRVTTFSHDRITGIARRPGTDALRVSYSPYWSARGSASCVVRGRGGMSTVRFTRAGAFSLTMTSDPITIVHRIADPDC